MQTGNRSINTWDLDVQINQKHRSALRKHDLTNSIIRTSDTFTPKDPLMNKKISLLYIPD